MLRDHFHPPLSLRRHWHAFHNAWATYIAAALNQQLPAGYFAEPNVQFGIEIDVATFEDAKEGGAEENVVSLPTSLNWVPPAPVMTIPLTLVTDTIEISVFNNEAGPVLAGAIELISPANKDRAEQCDAFVSRCAAYLQQGIGLIMVDVVTSRRANLHNQLLARLGATQSTSNRDELYASAYHPLERDGETKLDIWQEVLSLGNPLPTLPLFLRDGLCLSVDLQATYERTCMEQRITMDAA